MRTAMSFREVGCRLLLGVLLGISSVVMLAADSPDDRPITDPKSVVSASNPDAGAVPIAQLYYTRSTSGPAWSPDGQQIAFTTNLTGRYNLWKVPVSGGWPIRSEER